VIQPDGTKWCKPCQVFHPVAEFGHASQSADGYGWYCKKVANKRRLDAYYRAKQRKQVHVPFSDSTASLELDAVLRGGTL
jgi:hypothetical protein